MEYYYARVDVGHYCHWCGAEVHGRGPKTGKHVYCRNNGKCKMAHARAFAKYNRRVTLGEISPAGLGRCSSSKGNGDGDAACRGSSGAISKTAARRSNQRKR